MQSTITIAAVRGAGITFPLASLLYVFTGQLYCFALLPVGALIGFGVGCWLVRHPRPVRLPALQAVPAVRKPGWLERSLRHPNLLIRALSLAALCALLFLAAWTFSYYLLPEGAFRAGTEAHMARAALDASSASVLDEWSKIFRANLLAAAIIVLGSLLLRVNGFSFGYLVALWNVTGYGLYLGTNSFAISMPVRMAPTLAVLQRSGPYEMAALLLLAAATSLWPRFEIRQLFRTNLQRVRPRPGITWFEAVVTLLAIALLAAANWAEAAAVIAASAYR